MTKPLPKSLHTVTVLVQVAKLHMRISPALQPQFAVLLALDTLGYDADTIDFYGLKQQAVAKLNK